MEEDGREDRLVLGEDGAAASEEVAARGGECTPGCCCCCAAASSCCKSRRRCGELDFRSAPVRAFLSDAGEDEGDGYGDEDVKKADEVVHEGVEPVATADGG